MEITNQEILSFDTCPNCWSKNFIIEKRTCLDCWYNLEHNNIDFLEHYFEEIIKNISEQISSKIFKLKKYNFESYKILIEWKKIKWIKFYVYDTKFGKKAFYTNIEYKIIDKNFDEIEFYETDPEERIHHYEIHKIEIEPINYIFEKTKVWYKEKKSLNYYKQIDSSKLQEFIEEIIKKYHNFI